MDHSVDVAAPEEHNNKAYDVRHDFDHNKREHLTILDREISTGLAAENQEDNRRESSMFDVAGYSDAPGDGNGDDDGPAVGLSSPEILLLQVHLLQDYLEKSQTMALDLMRRLNLALESTTQDDDIIDGMVQFAKWQDSFCESLSYVVDLDDKPIQIRDPKECAIVSDALDRLNTSHDSVPIDLEEKLAAVKDSLKSVFDNSCELEQMGPLIKSHMKRPRSRKAQEVFEYIFDSCADLKETMYGLGIFVGLCETDLQLAADEHGMIMAVFPNVSVNITQREG